MTAINYLPEINKRVCVCIYERTVPSVICGNCFVRDVWQFLWKLLLLHRNVEVEALVALKKCRMKKIWNPVEQLQVMYSMCVTLQITAP